MAERKKAMEKVRISDKQGIVLITMFILGSTLIMGTGGEAKQDMWIAILLSIMISIPVLLMYSHILSSYPGKDLFDILIVVFGKTAGKIISIPMIWFSIHLGTLVLRNYGEFIKTSVLPETPMIVSIISLGFIVAWGVKLGMEVLSRWAELFIIIVIGVIILVAFASIAFARPHNLLPILYNGFNPILKGAFSALTFPFGETVIFTMVFSSLNSRASARKVFLYGLFIGGFIVLYAAVRNIVVLGADSIANLYFPSYHAVSRLSIGTFFQRFEVTVAIIFTIAGYTKICICLMAASIGISKLFDIKDYKLIVTPICIIMVYLSYIVYESTLQMKDWAFKIWPYYAILFQILIPSAILASIYIKKAIAKSNKS